MMDIESFEIAVSQACLDDLRQRLVNARFPWQMADSGWSLGPDEDYMRELIEYWRDDYDWRKHEAMLNGFAQYRARVDDCWIHYLHVRSEHEQAMPLVLTHGWPGSVMEFYKIIDPLVAPERHGGEPEDAFHVICPSMTGYAWSDPWPAPGCDIAMVAQRQNKLLAGLGYERYAVQGGDWGGLASPYMAVDAPEQVIGVHLNLCITGGTEDPEEAAAQGVPPGPSSLNLAYANQQKGYAVIQGLKPDQLAYALNDSPLGLAAWIVDCFYTWGDCAGDIESRFTKDELLTNIMIYWVSGAMPSAIRLYHESMKSGRYGPPLDYTAPPTAVALFKDISNPKLEWAQKLYNIQRWTEMPSGGHFAALEEPQLLIDDIRAFFAELR